jgi:nitrile hydratase subunit beta
VNGGQDLGGQMGFGPINPEPDEPVFHGGWERRVLAMSVAAGAMGHWSIDESRHARESIPPADYLSFSYYRIWLAGLEKLLLDHGFVTPQELDKGHDLVRGTAPKRVLRGADVSAVLHRGFAADRPTTSPARFSAGDHVRTINMHPKGHTRLPRYARARSGLIEQAHGMHVLPDSSAHGKGESPQWLYTVVFTGTELWGRDSDPTLTVSVECWESYLEPA